MAVALQGAPTVQEVDVPASSVTFSATVASGTDTVMAVCVESEGTGAGGGNVTSITFNSDALTKLDEAVNATWSFTEIWQRIAPDITTANVVVTLDVSDPFIVGVYVADGVDQTTPLRTAAKSTGSSTSVSNTVASVASDDLVFDSLAIDSSGHSGAVGADQTERWDRAGATNMEGLSSTQAGSSGGVMSWTWTTSAPFSHVATAFIASGAAAAAAAQRRIFVFQGLRPLLGVLSPLAWLIKRRMKLMGGSRGAR